MRAVARIIAPQQLCMKLLERLVIAVGDERRITSEPET